MFYTYGPCFSKDESQHSIFSTVHPQQIEINLESHIIFFSFHHGEPFKNTFNAIDFFKKIAC